MKILITGASGFLGSYLLKSLLKKAHQIIALKRSFSNIFRIENEISRIKVYDIDKRLISDIFNENKDIDLIIHTATSRGYNEESALDIFKTNVRFPLELLDFASKNGIKSFINTGSVLPLIYGGVLYEHLLSKKQFFDWGKIYSSKINFINVNLDYLYGPFEDKIKFIPFLVEKCTSDCGQINITSGSQKRNFIYIDDVINAYLLIIQNIGLGFTEYNIGGANTLTIKEAAVKIKKITQSKIILNFGAIAYRDKEPMEIKSNMDNLFALGWKPKVGFEDGIREILKQEYKR
ncbi:MAG: NAD(P)-dependent oxidoreductase [Elusimicrobiota bacterium]|jgi:nucleoside-diphosphate-sugar epimerase|nr:NAD(P)-dependent oxidoreductase [Elusimicrobiota bacterium]